MAQRAPLCGEDAGANPAGMISDRFGDLLVPVVTTDVLARHFGAGRFGGLLERRHGRHGCGCSSAVERNLAKVEVEGSIPFARSKQKSGRGLKFCVDSNSRLWSK